MTTESNRIWLLIGELSEAFWKRCAKSTAGFLNAFLERPYRAQSDEERAIWDELTAPHNYEALIYLIHERQKLGRNEFAVHLDESLLKDATSRFHRDANVAD